MTANLSQAQQQQMLKLTEQAIDFLSSRMNHTLPKIDVLFDLSGRSAGMYVRKRRHRLIRYNPYIFAKFFSDNINVTIPHEVAHYAADSLYGMQNIKPHGKEWKAIMQLFGVDDSATCGLDFSGVPMRQYQRIDYRCRCRTHSLTLIRHNRIQRGQRYHCRFCQSEVIRVTG